MSLGDSEQVMKRCILIGHIYSCASFLAATPQVHIGKNGERATVTAWVWSFGPVVIGGYWTQPTGLNLLKYLEVCRFFLHKY